MKPYFLQNTVLVSLAFLSTTSLGLARPDTLDVYDENTSAPNEVEIFLTNHPDGFNGFASTIAEAWLNDVGGVMDEFMPNGQFFTFAGQVLNSGYGKSGYAYHPSVGTAGQGPSIEFASKSQDWEVVQGGKDAQPISFENFWQWNAGVQQDTVSYVLKDESGKETGQLLRGLGFTVLAQSRGLITATVNFDDGSAYSETFDTSGKNDVFFGAAAPAGLFVSSFSISSSDSEPIYLDDVAFSAKMADGLPPGSPVPEPGPMGLMAMVLGLGAAFRRRRMA
jgi:hypothetical protein